MVGVRVGVNVFVCVGVTVGVTVGVAVGVFVGVVVGVKHTPDVSFEHTDPHRAVQSRQPNSGFCAQ